MILRDIKNDMHTCQVCKKLIKDEDVAYLCFNPSYKANKAKENATYDEAEVCESCRNKIFNMIKEGEIN